MKIVKREIVEVEGDCNMNDIYNKFNELTGLNEEFEIGQEYGTSCYGIHGFSNGLYKGDYPTLEELEAKIENYKAKRLEKVKIKWEEIVDQNDVVNYLRRKGILPEADLLFIVDY